ncbi:MAG: hypothetical protein AAGJ46_07035 [Planctomycetota bacterium]
MPTHEFSVILSAASELTDERLLDVADRLAECGCDDATIVANRDGVEAMFDRDDDSLDSAIAGALRDIQSTGLKPIRVELDPERIAPASAAG